MRELWVLKHDYWALPIYVEWPDQYDVARVKLGAGIRLMEVQRVQGSELLSSMGEKVAPNKWNIFRQELEQKAARADTVNPEECVEWRSFAANVRFRFTKDKASQTGLKERDEFFYEFSKLGVIQDPVVAEVVWHSFCRHALHWLLNKRRPVDMLFCELHPMPFRPNWPHILLDADLRRSRKGKPFVGNTAEDLIERGVVRDMLAPEMLFVNEKDRTIYWSIGVLATEMWYRMVGSIEQERKKQKRNLGYFIAIANEMKRALPAAIKIYANFISEISRPFAKIRPGRGKNGRIRKNPGAIKVAHIPARSPVSLEPDHLKSSQRSVPLTSEESIGYLSTMPDLRRPKKDVRHTGDHLAQRSDTTGGTDGLPLSDGCCGVGEA